MCQHGQWRAVYQMPTFVPTLSGPEERGCEWGIEHFVFGWHERITAIKIWISIRIKVIIDRKNNHFGNLSTENGNGGNELTWSEPINENISFRWRTKPEKYSFNEAANGIIPRTRPYNFICIQMTSSFVTWTECIMMKTTEPELFSSVFLFHMGKWISFFSVEFFIHYSHLMPFNEMHAHSYYKNKRMVYYSLLFRFARLSLSLCHRFNNNLNWKCHNFASAEKIFQKKVNRFNRAKEWVWRNGERKWFPVSKYKYLIKCAHISTK